MKRLRLLAPVLVVAGCGFPWSSDVLLPGRCEHTSDCAPGLVCNVDPTPEGDGRCVVPDGGQDSGIGGMDGGAAGSQPDAGPGPAGGASGQGGQSGNGSGGAAANSSGGAGAGGLGGAPGTGGAPIAPCASGADCASTPQKPLCDPTSHLCVACADSVCAQISPTKPVCGVGTQVNSCVQCSVDAQCAGKSATPVCSAGACVACNQSTDCKSPLAPICNTTTHVCSACTVGQCSAKSPATPACLTSGACAECGVESDCVGITGRPACSPTNVCVQCTSDSQCSGSTPICDKTANKCIACTGDAACKAKSATAPACLAGGACAQCSATNATQCAGGTPVCSSGNACVQCTDDSQCSGATPICDKTANKCIACTGDAACKAKSASAPACLAGGACAQCSATNATQCVGETPVCSNGNVCVQCTGDGNCSGTTPICDTTMNKCGACTADSQCAGKTSLPPNPGVCMSHTDGHCAVDSETVYVMNRAGCSDTGAATSAAPLCSMNGVQLALGTRTVVVVRGSSLSANGAIGLSGGKLVSIVGQNAGAITGTMAPALWISGDTYARDLKLSSMTTAVQANSGATLRLNHVSVVNSPGGGILLDGAAFDIRNTIVTGNGPGMYGVAIWGGILINNPPAAGPSRLQFLTVQANNQVGIACSATVTGTGVLASGNAGGVNIATTCGFTSCSAASATCGAMP